MIIIGAASIALTAAQTALKTVEGKSINNGIWSIFGLLIVTAGGIWLAYIKQWGPWKQADTVAREADFARLRDEIAQLKIDHKSAMEEQNKRIERLEEEGREARTEARLASAHALQSDAKLQSTLAACELLLGLVEREMPEASEIKIARRLLAQAATNDMGVGDGLRRLATVRNTAR